MDNERAADLSRINQISVPVQAEIEEVSQDEIGKRMAVSFELLGALNVVEVLFGWSLRLDIADDVLFPIPNPEVRVPRFSLFGENRDVRRFLAN